jgi:hypothetical protein
MTKVHSQRQAHAWPPLLLALAVAHEAAVKRPHEMAPVRHLKLGSHLSVGRVRPRFLVLTLRLVLQQVKLYKTGTARRQCSPEKTQGGPRL